MRREGWVVVEEEVELCLWPPIRRNRMGNGCKGACWNAHGKCCTRRDYYLVAITIALDLNCLTLRRHAYCRVRVVMSAGTLTKRVWT